MREEGEEALRAVRPPPPGTFVPPSPLRARSLDRDEMRLIRTSPRSC